MCLVKLLKYVCIGHYPTMAELGLTTKGWGKNCDTSVSVLPNTHKHRADSGSANEWQRYFVTTSLIGWAQA